LEIRNKGKKIEPGDELQKTAIIDLVLGDGSGNLRRDVEAPINNNQNNKEDEGE